MTHDGGYNFTDSRGIGGADRGVATPWEKRELAIRCRAAKAEAAANAEAVMAAKIAAIQGSAQSADRKRYLLNTLSPSGLSSEEDRILREVQQRV